MATNSIVFMLNLKLVPKRVKMARAESKQLHFSMFPWFAFGHMNPYLHLANKLAERGHIVSFLLPRGAQPRMQQLSLHPTLISFYPLDVPHVDGLLPGAETGSDVPFPAHTHLCTAFDQTRNQVEPILTKLKPDFILFDFGFWVPALVGHLGTKSVYYSVVSAAANAWADPALSVKDGSTLAEIMHPPPGYPSSVIKIRPHENEHFLVVFKEMGSGLTLHERLTSGMKNCDAIAMRTCQEIEGRFCDYIAQQYSKSVLLTGPVLPTVASLDEQWVNWLSKFKPGSVVFCALGSQIVLQKEDFQELILGFELAQLPFLVALTPPQGCSTIKEALPQGFEERVRGRGLVHGGWVPQPEMLKHPSIGCFVSHCGYGSMWESLISDCQIVLLPFLADQCINTRLMVEELKVAVEVPREGSGQFTKENLSQAIVSVMDDGEVATLIRANHGKLKDIVFSQDKQGVYIDSFIQNMKKMLE